VGLGAALRSRWRRGPKAALDLSLSYLRPTRSSDNSIWAWNERGYPLLAETGVTTTVAGPLRRSGQLGIDLGLASAVTAWSWLRLEGFWRRYTDLALVERVLSLDPVDHSFGGPADLATGSGGQIAGGLITASLGRKGVASRISYRFQQAFAGDDRFRSGQATIPNHRIRHSLEVSVASGLDLWSMLEYRSATRWRDFDSVEAQTGGAYQAEVPGWAAFDIAIQKWLWKRRLRAHLGFRNVLGAEVRYHPAGSTIGPRMYVQVEGAVP
jgi:hypothetical protein